MLKTCYEVRTARSSDLTEILQLTSTENFELKCSLIIKSIRNNSMNLTIMKYQKELIGLAMSGTFVGEEVSLMYLLISSYHRDHGFGKMILKENLEFWKRRGAMRCLLELRESNKGTVNP